MDFTGMTFTVCIQCFTYNQESYILDALNGFVSQVTSFPVVSVIVDDASADNEPRVIRDFFNANFDSQETSVAYQEENEYGTVLFARHRVNKNCFFAIVLLKENHFRQKKSKFPYLSRWIDKSKYIALCDGDDYWTDPLKLQTQVLFLDEHKEYSLCCHRYRIFKQNSGSWGKDYVHALFDHYPNGFSFTRSDNLKTWITKTMTLMYRRDWITMEELQKYKYRCDEHLNYHLLSHGLGYCFPFFGAVYRQADSGVFSMLSEEKKTRRYFLIRSELLKFNLKDVDLRDILFQKVRKRLFSQGIDKTILYAARVCVQSFYRTAGIKAALVSIKKILAAYLKGMNNRAVASVE